MPDLSQIPDDQLMGMLSQSSQPNLSNISNDDLMKMVGSQPNQQRPQQSIQDPSNTNPGIGTTLLEQGMQGLTMGWGNKLVTPAAAELVSIATGKPYSEIEPLTEQLTNQRQQAEQTNHPIASTVGQVGGAGLGMVAGGDLLAAAAPEKAAALAKFGAANPKTAIATLGGGMGAVQGASQGDDLESHAKNAAIGAGFGASSALGLYGLGSAAGAAKNSVMPTVDEYLAPLAQKAMDTFGIPLTRTQVGGGKFAKALSSVAGEVPFSGAQDFTQQQLSAFNKAVAGTFGEDADRITPDVIDSAYKNIGAKFDAAFKGKQIQVPPSTLDDLTEISTDANQFLTADRAKLVNNQIDRMLGDVGDDATIPGERLNSLRSSITKAMRGPPTEMSSYLGRIKDTITDLADDPEARQQYKNLKTVEPLAAKAVDGNVSPSLLSAAVRKSYSDFPRGGGGDLGDLARIGQAFLKETTPNSGTPLRQRAQSIIYGGGIPALGAGLATGSVPVGVASLGSAIPLAKGYTALNQAQPLVRRAVQSALSNAGSEGGLSPVISSVLGSKAADDFLQPHSRGGRTYAQGGSVNLKPTEAQKEAGNYKKGHIKIYGLDCTIENPKGSTRSGKDRNGKEWKCTLPADYGYFKRTEGADGDHVDCYIGPKRGSAKAYVIDQVDKDSKRWDEHKVMLGYLDAKSAIDAYNKAFSDGKGHERIGKVTETSINKLKNWLKSGNTMKPLAKAA